MTSEIKLRKYHRDDYDQVSQIYQDGIREVNMFAHQSLYNGKFPQLIFCEILVFVVGCMIGHYGLNVGYKESLVCGTISLLIFCCLSLLIRYMWTRNYLRYVMGTDLKDPTLRSWTTYPNAFFIATFASNQKRVLGFVACKTASDTTVELARLTVVPEARHLGIGRMLVIKLIDHARHIGCQKVYLTTWKTMYAAVGLYKKLGFRIVGHIHPRYVDQVLQEFFKNQGFKIQLKYIFPMIGERIPELLLEL